MFGNVVIVGIYMWEKKLQKFAQYVHILKHILKLEKLIIKK